MHIIREKEGEIQFPITLILENIGILAPCSVKKEGILEQAVILISGDTVMYAGKSSDAPKYKQANDCHIVDCSNKVVVPGFVGSFPSTTDLDSLTKMGWTTVEIFRQGGQSSAGDIAVLERIKKQQAQHDLDITTSYKLSPGDLTERKKQVEEIGQSRLATFLHIPCTGESFTSNEFENLVRTGLDNGFLMKAELDTESHTQSAHIAVKGHARMVDGLHHTQREELELFKRRGVVAKISLKEVPKNISIMQEVGNTLAIQTETSESQKYFQKIIPGLSILDKLAMLTNNNAASICMDALVGSLEEMKQADILIYDCTSLDGIGGKSQPIVVIKRGEIIHD